jgi:hypothetical protein
MRLLKLSIFLFFVLIAGFFAVLYPAYTVGGNGAFSIVCNKDFYYVKGEVIQINITASTAFAVTLSIYWNWKTYTEDQLIYRSTKTTNATWFLPTATQRVGYYRIVGNSSQSTVTVWRTLIHYKNYQSASLPFNYTWEGVAYSLRGRNFTAQIADDYVTITYPKIPVQFNAAFYYNNMTFLVRLSGSGWAVDVLYMATFASLKWRVNGTLSNPQTFEFQCATNPLKIWKQRLDRFQSNGYLVFDWSDLRAAKKAFSWNNATKTLTVTIPSSFDIDPYVFQDGFEGIYSAPWTGVSVSGVTQSYSTDYAHHDAQSLKQTGINLKGEYAEIYKTITSGTGYYMRSYIYFSALPDASSYRHWVGPTFESSGGGSTIMAALIYKASGLQYWGVDYYQAGHKVSYGSATTINAGTWYCIEIHCVISGTVGVVQLWVDGVLIVDLSGLDTNDRGNIASGACLACAEVGACTAYTLYQDCAVIDTSYIGPEGWNLNLRVHDWDLVDHIQGALVYKDADVLTSDANGWANWTLVSGTVAIKVKYYGFWVNGTFSVSMTEDKTINVQCKLYDVTVTVEENGGQGAYLVSANVTVFNATSTSANKIKSGVTGSNGKVFLTNLPNGTLTFTQYAGSSYTVLIGNETEVISSENQSITVTSDQNYATTTSSFSIVGTIGFAAMEEKRYIYTYHPERVKGGDTL